MPGALHKNSTTARTIQFQPIIKTGNVYRGKRMTTYNIMRLVFVAGGCGTTRRPYRQVRWEQHSCGARPKPSLGKVLQSDNRHQISKWNLSPYCFNHLFLEKRSRLKRARGSSSEMLEITINYGTRDREESTLKMQRNVD